MDLTTWGINGHYRDGTLTLDLSHDMTRFDIRTRGGVALGRLYGYLLTTFHGDGIGIADGVITVPDDIATAQAFETRVLDHLHGLFVVHTSGPLPDRLYPDAGGGIPVSYSPGDGRIASSAGLMFDDAEYQDRFLRDRHARLIEKEISGSWIVGPATAHEGLYKLMPDFYLDLETWTAHRFWPREGAFALGLDFDEAVETVATAMQGYMEATVREYGLVAPTFTAGFDSRIILAACRNVAADIRLITMGSPGEGMDQILTADMAAKLGLAHDLVPKVIATEAQKAAWDRRVGHVVSEINRDLHPTLFGLPYDLMVTGMYGEAGRCRLYRYDMDTINDQPATAPFVLSRLTLPVDDEILPDIHAWVDGISWMPRSAVLDLAFNELRFGCWAMTQGPAQQAIVLTMMPFSQRAIQNAFMSVTPSEKGTETLFRAIGTRLWPEVMEFNVNRFGDYRDYTSKLKKVFKRDHLVRFVRDRFARP